METKNQTPDPKQTNNKKTKKKHILPNDMYAKRSPFISFSNKVDMHTYFYATKLFLLFSLLSLIFPFLLFRFAIFHNGFWDKNRRKKKYNLNKLVVIRFFLFGRCARRYSCRFALELSFDMLRFWTVLSIPLFLHIFFAFHSFAIASNLFNIVSFLNATHWAQRTRMKTWGKTNLWLA